MTSKSLRPGLLLGVVFGVVFVALLALSRAQSDSLSGTGHVNLMDIAGQPVLVGPGAPYGALRVVPAENLAIFMGTYHSAASDNSTSIKGSGGFLHELIFTNSTPDAMDIRLFDTTGTPDCTDPGDSQHLKANFLAMPGQMVIPLAGGVQFTYGITFCITGQNSDTDDTNAEPGLNLTWVAE